MSDKFFTMLLHGQVDTMAGTIQILDDLDSAQYSQHTTTRDNQVIINNGIKKQVC